MPGNFRLLIPLTIKRHPCTCKFDVNWSWYKLSNTNWNLQKPLRATNMKINHSWQSYGLICCFYNSDYSVKIIQSFGLKTINFKEVETVLAGLGWSVLKSDLPDAAHATLNIQQVLLRNRQASAGMQNVEGSSGKKNILKGHKCTGIIKCYHWVRENSDIGDFREYKKKKMVALAQISSFHSTNNKVTIA